jgi:hypothetical protein
MPGARETTGQIEYSRAMKAPGSGKRPRGPGPRRGLDP